MDQRPEHHLGAYQKCRAHLGGGSSVKHLTFDLGLGFDLGVVSSSPTLGSTPGMEPAYKMQILRSHPRLVLKSESAFSQDAQGDPVPFKV